MEMVTAADGTNVAYQRDGDGPPLVLVHGSGQDHTRWARSLPGLTRQTSVYAIDRRGRGGSGDTDDYALEDEVDDLLAVLDAIDAPSPCSATRTVRSSRWRRRCARIACGD